MQTEARGWGSGSGSQSGRFAGSAVAQQGGDLVLVEVQAEPAQGQLRGAGKALLQAPYGDPWNQARWYLFHQHCRRRAGSTVGALWRGGGGVQGVWGSLGDLGGHEGRSVESATYQSGVYRD